MLHYYLNRIKKLSNKEGKKTLVISIGVGHNVSGDEVFDEKENNLPMSQFLLQIAVSLDIPNSKQTGK